MPKRDPRVDAYIAKSADFAKPILKYLREVIHEACPPVEETIKWGFPHFTYQGILCATASFKGSLIVGDGERDAMGHLGKIRKLSDLPSKRVLASYIKKAMKLNEAGVKSPTRSKPKVKRPVVIPAELKDALASNKKASAAFEVFSPSHRREYAEWIAEAKGEDTRKRRVNQAIEWISSGKSRNWKYE
jgi:bacteriocin resistance YdeI/OmpD-like protein/uncharacterized protein DUF1801